MMKTQLAFIFFLGFAANSFAADIEAGKAKAVACSGCHGADGISLSPEWPNLAGQKELYIVKQLKDFQSGDRENALMSPMAIGLTERDMADIAAYFASL